MSLLLFAGAATAALVVDQVTKLVVVRRLVPSGQVLRLVHNRRGALVALPSAPAIVVLVAVSGTAVALAIQGGGVTAAGLGLLVGGAAGNLADRLRHGAVVDFIAAGPWPVFNLADAAMVAGVVVALGGVL